MHMPMVPAEVRAIFSVTTYFYIFKLSSWLCCTWYITKIKNRVILNIRANIEGKKEYVNILPDEPFFNHLSIYVQ